MDHSFSILIEFMVAIRINGMKIFVFINCEIRRQVRDIKGLLLPPSSGLEAASTSGNGTGNCGSMDGSYSYNVCCCLNILK